MKRVELLEKLRLVEPALATVELIPALTHFWFRHDRVMAFNDQIAISTPLECGFEAAVPGKRLLDLLMTSGHSNFVNMELDGAILKVKLGAITNAKAPMIQLPTLPPDAFVFDLPEIKNKESLPVDPTRFLACINNCMRSVSRDASMPEKLGITLIPGKTELNLFSTDSTTISHAKAELNKGGRTDLKRNILSQPFCEQLLRLAQSAASLQLEVQEDYSMLVVNGNMLFGRLIESERPLNFNEVYDRYFPEKLRGKLIPIPHKLEQILQRACIITDSKVTKQETNISVDNGEMKFLSKSNHGEIAESLKIKQHPDVSVAFNPKFLHTGVTAFADTGQMLLTNTCAIISKDDLTYLVAPAV